MRGRQEKRSDLRLRFLRHVGEVIGLFAVKGAGNAESFDRLEYGSLDSLLASTHAIQCLGSLSNTLPAAQTLDLTLQTSSLFSIVLVIAIVRFFTGLGLGGDCLSLQKS